MSQICLVMSSYNCCLYNISESFETVTVSHTQRAMALKLMKTWKAPMFSSPKQYIRCFGSLRIYSLHFDSVLIIITYFNFYSLNKKSHFHNKPKIPHIINYYDSIKILFSFCSLWLKIFELKTKIRWKFKRMKQLFVLNSCVNK